MTEVAFWIIAVILVCSAVAVVVLRDLFRSALLLIVSFFAVAAIYITLYADFLAAVQVLIYAGAIGILIIFAVMLTRDLRHGNPFNKISGPALLLALLLLAAIVGVVVTTDWPTVSQVPQVVEMPLHDPNTGQAIRGSTSFLATALFDRDGGFVLPFEIASVLLLAALLGAIVLVRRKEKD
jgi:NADH:ubiquinone oxidoreductase subunit 6 (subunit J)